MKKLITCVTVLSAVILATSFSIQAQQFDSRLLAKYSKKELKQMAETNDPRLAYLTHYLDNGFRIVDIPAGKEDSRLEVIRLKSLNPKDVNLLALGLTQHESARTYYRIEGTDKMLMLLPRKEVEEAMGNGRR
jgi:hypothetical protein